MWCTKMVNIADANGVELINKIASEIKKKDEFKQPEWTIYVKTGCNRERNPANPDWWYVRVASIFRRIYFNGPVGTERLRSYYGGRKRRGVKPPEFRKAAGKIIRVSLQQLDKAGYLKKEKKGRLVSAKGESFLLKLAKEVVKENKQNTKEVEHTIHEVKSHENKVHEVKNETKIENKIISEGK